MSDLENEIERLISEKKRIKEKLSENFNDKDDSHDDNLKISIEKSTESNPIEVDIIKFKKETLKQLADAKIGHKKWMSYVQILIALGDIQSANAEIPVNYTMCDFGVWYYGHGQLLNEYDRFDEIEEIHQEVHDTYLKIYNLYKNPLKGSLLKSLKKAEFNRQENAEKLAIVLKQHSKTLFEILNDMSDRLKKMSNEKLTEMIS